MSPIKTTKCLKARSRPSKDDLKEILDALAVELFFLDRNSSLIIQLRRTPADMDGFEDVVIAQKTEPLLSINNHEIRSTITPTGEAWAIDKHPNPKVIKIGAK